MDITDKSFSIVPKMRGMIIFGYALAAVCIVNTVRIIVDFENAFIKANLLAKFVAGLLVFTIFLVSALLLFSPFRYRVFKEGIRIESLMRRLDVSFSDVDAVVVDIPPKQRNPVERVVLFVGQKAYFLVGLASDYEQLRDHVLAQLDPKIIDDRRPKRSD